MPVVADVERYPEFLPWVVALRSVAAPRRAREILTAEMAVGYGGLRERYTSRCDARSRRAHASMWSQIKGPFQRLENHWRFTPEGDGAEVDFRVAFEFNSRLLQMAAGSAFEKVLLKMTDAFEARAAILSRPGLRL